MCLFVPPDITVFVLNNAPSEIRRQFFKAYSSSLIGSAVRPYTGNFINVINQSELLGDGGNGKVARTIYDAENRQSLPGKVVRKEGQKSNNDKQADEAYDFSGYTHEFFQKLFKRDSIDNKGFHLHSTVHFGHKYPNAFWNGRSMTYGDGDGEIFNPFTVLDVVAHELTHGVTEHTVGLEYYSQSGALNEHFSDVFGSLVKQYVRKQTADKADWIIGEGLFTDKINGVGIRSMKAPGTAYDDKLIGKDRQPAHMKNYYEGPDDNAGVHINSGIPNKAFYEVAINIGGYAWDKAGKIWYETLTGSKLHERSNFKDMADATVQTAIELYGTGVEYKAVREAWKSVGVVPTHHIFKTHTRVIYQSGGFFK